MDKRRSKKLIELVLSDGSTVKFIIHPYTHCPPLPYNNKRIHTTMDYKWIDNGIMQVAVRSIRGTASNSMYDKNFLPLKPDVRWMDVYVSMRDHGDVPNFPDIPRFTYFNGKYYVEGDGNRRTSVAKLLSLEYITCRVHEACTISSVDAI